MVKEIKITTIDNPFSPFTQFDAWYQYDTMNGYDTLGVLSRMTLGGSASLSEQDQQRIYEDAMIALYRMLPNIYRLVLKDDY